MKPSFRISPSFAYLLTIVIQVSTTQLFGGYVGYICMIVCGSIFVLYLSYSLYKRGGTRRQMIGLIACGPLLVLLFAIIGFVMSL
jgi:hypothetical protein